MIMLRSVLVALAFLGARQLREVAVKLLHLPTYLHYFNKQDYYHLVIRYLYN